MGSSNYRERLDGLLAFLHEFKIQLSNTYLDPGSNAWTHQPYDKSKPPQQLDYVGAPTDCASFTSGIFNHIKFHSDHFPVWTIVRDSNIVRTRTRTVRQSRAGWQPSDDGAIEMYKQNICNQFSQLYETNTFSLSRLSPSLVDATVNVPSSCAFDRGETAQQRPAVLIEMEERVAGMSPGAEKKKLKTILHRHRRRYRIQCLHYKSSTMGKKQYGKHPVEQLYCNGELSHDRQQWASEVTRHCKSKYKDESETPEVIHQRIQYFWDSAKLAMGDGWAPPHYGVELLLNCRAGMAMGRVAGGDDPVIAEFIRLIPWAWIVQIWELFRARFLGINLEDLPAWKLIVLIFMAKEYKPTSLTRFRGLSLLSVTSKWYMGTLIELARRSCREFPTILCMGFEPGCSCDSLNAIILFLFAKHYEWRGKMAIHMFIGDIAEAFDHLSPGLISLSLEHAEVHPTLIAAILYEIADCELQANLQGVPAEERIPFTRCCRTGGKESPYCWNRSVTYVLSRHHDDWVDRGLAISLGPGLDLTHLVWADNFVLLSSSQDGLRTMTEELTVSMNDIAGWTWKPGSHLYMSSDQSAPPLAMDLVDGNIVLENASSIPNLGTTLTFDGGCMEDVMGRLQKATAKLYANKDLYTSTALPVKTRFKMFAKFVLPVACYGSCHWIWSKALHDHLRTWEGAFLRRVAGIRRKPAEEWVRWTKRATKAARRMFCAEGYDCLTTRVLTAIFRLAGKARHLEDDFNMAVVPRAWKLMDETWWKQYKAEGNQLDSRNQARWKHCSEYKRVGHWEDVIFDFL